jgi:hypothetical protein
MVPVSAFFSRLLPNVIGCPEPLAQQALVDSAIEFCSQSLVTTTDLDPVSVTAGVGNYELDLPAQTELAQIMRVWLDGRMLGPVPTYEVQSVESFPGMPTYYFGRDIDEVLNVRLFPTPDKDVPNGLVVRVATKPTRTATQVHSVLFERWSDVIVEGALARLFDTPGQVFTNEAKALVLNQKVRAKTAVARTDAMRGRTVSSMSVTMRSF